MEGSRPSYCSLWDTKKQSRFLCYTHRKHGTCHVRLTDAADVWSTEYTEDTWNQFRPRLALNSPEDYILKLRSACGRGEVSVEVRDTGAELHLSSGPGDQSVTLSRLEGPQAAEELKELLFRMADSLTQPEGGPSVSPVKNHQRPKEFEPQQQQSCAPSVTMKKRLPGASLINPGTKRKRQATGVAFDDED